MITSKLKTSVGMVSTSHYVVSQFKGESNVNLDLKETHSHLVEELTDWLYFPQLSRNIFQ